MKMVTGVVMTVALLGAGCAASKPSAPEPLSYATATSSVALPLDGNIAGYNPTYKRFGEFFSDRFTGYHVGEDSEVVPEDLGPGETQEVPVHAIANGMVMFAGHSSGYGGVVVIAHEVASGTVNAIYGHLDSKSAVVKKGDRVRAGQFIANLGEGFTSETDGKRQHLHFALYRGGELRLRGYEPTPARVRDWINPHDFFREYITSYHRGSGEISSDALTDPQGKRVFGKLTFVVPDDWDVEFVPTLKALNLYRVSGSGTARERSQLFIRYFDADRFLTLGTVSILSSSDLDVGAGNYRARRYEIVKKPGVPDFPDQPTWRNAKHTVTDFRAGDGYTRYYVVAANPDLDPAVYDRVLSSMRIIQ